MRGFASVRERVGCRSPLFSTDDVFNVFHGMPRAALIVTELGPRATLVRMRCAAPRRLVQARSHQHTLGAREHTYRSRRGCNPPRGRLARAGGCLPHGANTVDRARTVRRPHTSHGSWTLSSNLKSSSPAAKPFVDFLLRIYWKLGIAPEELANFLFDVIAKRTCFYL